MIDEVDEYKYAYLTDRIKQLQGVAHMIAHNLRGAGANIKMLSEVLMKKEGLAANDDADTEDEFTINEAVQYIHESSASLLHTLNMLLEVADIELNEKIKHDECDIVGITQHIFSQLHGLIHQKQAVIEFDLQLKVIHYPQAYMESILYNLINNALKYSRPGVPLTITVATYMRGGQPVLSVKDNGQGIDLQKNSKRMFGLDEALRPGKDSKGVGLYITRTQIESLGGHITVRSAVGEGSEFIVVF